MTGAKQRFLAMKRRHRGSLLLFREDFLIVAYCEDARVLASLFGLLLCRGKRAVERLPHCTFPEVMLDRHCATLARCGHPTVLVEQPIAPRRKGNWASCWPEVYEPSPAEIAAATRAFRIAARQGGRK